MGYRCNKFLKRLCGFLTDHDQRRVMGVGILYVLGFPILLIMILVGSLKAAPPGEENPACPAEPNLPWFLVLGGIGISILLLVRIGINTIMHHVKNTWQDSRGVCCEFSCNLLYDIIVMVIMVMWLITVSWWVFRHRIGPDSLYAILGKEKLDNFRASLGDNDTIYNIQFVDAESNSFCDQLLYLVASVLLSFGWIVLTGALIVFISDKIFNKIVFCRLCSSITMNKHLLGTDEEQIIIQSNDYHPSYTVDL